MDLSTYLDGLPAGGKTAVAKAAGVAPAYLYQMANGIRPVPPGRCRALAQATDGKVSVHDLRPDVFGPSPVVGGDGDLAARTVQEDAA